MQNRFHYLFDDENPLFDYETIGEMILAAAFYTFQLAGEMSVVHRSLGMAAIERLLAERHREFGGDKPILP